MSKFTDWLDGLIRKILSILQGQGASSVSGPQPVVPPASVKPPQDAPKPLQTLQDLIKLTKGTLDWYALAYQLCTPDKGYELAINADAQVVVRGKVRYQWLEKQTGLPWWVFGCLHFKEASCDFSCCLHNGDRIIGRDLRTWNEPKGRGPFQTFEESALDAIKLETFGKLKDFSFAAIFKAAEEYNGLGYLHYHQDENDPYLWARSNINDDFGKYVADGKWDSEATTEKTTGFAVLVRELQRMGEI